MAETIKVLNIGGSEYNFNATQLNGFNINDICNKSGENIIVGSSTASIVSNWSSTGWSGSITTYEVENGIYEVHSYNGWRTHVYEIPSEYLNTTLSYSFDVYYDSEKSTQAINGEAGITSTKGYGAGIFAFGADILTKPDTWVHYSGSFTPTDTNKYFGFFLRCTDSSSKSTYIRVKNLKIEKGNLSSIWTPSIKDVGFYDFSNNGNFTKLNIGGVTKELTINYATSAGNAATATKATNDSDGNAINSTYSKVGHGHTVLNPERYDSNAPAPNSKNGLTFQFSYNLGTGAGGWWNVLNMRSYTDKNYTSAQIITPADNPGKDTGYSGDMKWRQGRNSTWLDWKTILDSSNYTSYTVKKDGTGASGVWGINVTGSSGSCTGNAATATNASNASQLNGITGGYYVRNIEGEDFNPTAKSGVFIGMSTQTGISSDWTHVISMNWSGSGPSDIKANNINPTWQTQLALPTQGRYKTQGVKFRTFKNGSGVTEAYPWTQLLDEFNYTTYCTPANIGAAKSDHNHNSTYLKLSGGTMTGAITLAEGQNKGINFSNGATLQDVSKTDTNNIVLFKSALRFQTNDAAWDYSQWAGLKYDHSNKSIYLGLPGDGTIFTKNTETTKNGTLKLPNISSIKLDGNKGETYTVLHSGNSVGIFSSTQHSDYNNNQGQLITRSFMSYWNGAYNSSGSSNLTYCVKGAFGSIVTKSTTDYATSDHSHTSFASAVSFAAGLSSSANVTVTGKVSATQGFYEESDSRLKNFEDDINIDLDKIKQLPKKYFRWKEDPTNLQIGTSAQAVQELYPELVSENENGNLTVAYDKLSVIALAAVDQLSTELNTLKDELQQIKAHLNLI